MALHDLEDMAVDMSRDRLAPMDEELLPLARVGPKPGVCVGACIWYRQTPARLRRLIQSAAEHGLDGMVFLDGPYKGLSDVERSEDESYLAITEAAADFSLPVRSYWGRVWISEPSKRTASARYALEMAEVIDPDKQPWFMYIDSDEFLMGPIDWAVISRYGYGSIRLCNWRGEERKEEGEGEGATMARIFPNSPGILFGPAHYDIRDNDIPATYMGWEKALSNDSDPCVDLGHDLGEKVIETEYQTYNDSVRYHAEGKVMRIVETLPKDGRLLIRMDQDSAESAGWKPGFVAKFNAAYVGTESPYGLCTEVMPTPGLEQDLYDLVFTSITPEEAAEHQLDQEREANEKEHDLGEKMRKRMRKRARRWDREHPGGFPEGFPR